MFAQCIVLQQPVKLAVIFKTDNNDVGESYAIYTCKVPAENSRAPRP